MTERRGTSGESTAAYASGSPPSSYGTVFLEREECSARAEDDFREVPCTSEKAAARVIARHGGRQSDGPRCPARTDFVLHITQARPSVDEDGDGTVPQGYACMRNLEPPHPGDPGGGGGPLTITGDCVYRSREGEVKETACDGSGERAPQFRITTAVGRRSECPSATLLYVQVGGERPVGCAREL
nr:hypothetical protein [Streptomyces sp. GC420]